MIFQERRIAEVIDEAVSDKKTISMRLSANMRNRLTERQ